MSWQLPKTALAVVVLTLAGEAGALAADGDVLIGAASAALILILLPSSLRRILVTLNERVEIFEDVALCLLRGFAEVIFRQPFADVVNVLDDALKDFHAAARGLRDPTVEYHLARAYLKKGDADSARRHRDRARAGGLAPEQLQPCDRPCPGEASPKRRIGAPAIGGRREFGPSSAAEPVVLSGV